jgi:type IX secretion system PorP/SprF family membrane protein
MRRICRVGVILLLAVCSKGYAQQDPVLTQYMFNTNVLNPAYAGTNEFASATLISRKQWVNLEGAPKTDVLSFDSPIKFFNTGIAAIVSSDRTGVIRENNVGINFSKQLVLGKGRLSMGIRGGFAHYSANIDKLVYWDKTDPTYANAMQSRFVPKFGTGLFYYTDKWFAGIAVPTLLAYDPQNRFSFDPERSASYRRHFYTHGGYVFDISKNLKFKPWAMVKYVPAAPVQGDINLSFLVFQRFMIGAGYRTNAAFTGLTEFLLTKRLKIGYAYDQSTTIISTYGGGSHEVLLHYEFSKEELRTKNPRFF